MVHQARALEMAGESRVLIEAPTGAGKTWAAAAPLIESAVQLGAGSVFVYPTNALADDQAGSLSAVIERAGLVAGWVQKDGSIDVSGADILIWRVHAGAIDEARSGVGGRASGQVLSKMLERLPAKPLWLVTNPDTLFLLCTAKYSGSVQLWSRLRVIRAMVLDEFHLYRGPTLSRALAMIELARELLGTDKVRVLSATVQPSVRSLLVERFGFAHIVAEPSAAGRIVQHEINLDVVAALGEAATARIVAAVESELPALQQERSSARVPMLVLRQSVLATIILEDRLVERGLAREQIGIYRGLSSRAVRSIEEKTVVLGTSALEVGVDFLTSRLVFEAMSAASFAQRLGRVGRHEPGAALYLTDARVAEGLASFGDCDRPSLLRRMQVLLATDDDLAGFASSPFGRAVVRGAVDALRFRGKALGAPQEFQRLLDSVEATVCAQLGCTEMPPLALLGRAARTRLSGSVGFRGGEGSVEVFDVREERRRGSSALAVYEVPLVTFFRRAQCSNQPSPGVRPVVTGYVKPKRLSLSLNLLSEVSVGVHAPRPDQIELRVEGDATLWEALLREREHLVGLFPGNLREELSWREDVFESHDGRIALLDDDALVGAYLFSRRLPAGATG